MFVLGCVDDHIMAVGTVLAAARQSGFQTAHVRVGETAEFSSKVVHAVQVLHTRGGLRARLAQVVADSAQVDRGHNEQNTTGAAAIPAAEQTSSLAVPDPNNHSQSIPRTMRTMGSQSNLERCELHFWVFCGGCLL